MLTEREVIVMANVGGPGALRARIDAGEFPRPVQVGPAGPMWDPAEVDAVTGRQTRERKEPGAVRRGRRRK